MRKTIRIRELYNKTPNAIRNNRVVADFLEEKKNRQETMIMKILTPSRNIEKIEESHEYYNSDEEDFTYSFTTKIGQARKKYYKLLDISRHPDYTPHSGCMSAIPRSRYNPFTKIKVQEKYTSMEEAFRIKKCFAKNRMVYNINDLGRLDTRLKSSSLPKGGEMLLKK